MIFEKYKGSYCYAIIFIWIHIIKTEQKMNEKYNMIWYN